MNTGMTLKQYHRDRYLRVCEALRVLRAMPLDAEHKTAFVRLSLEAQQLRAYVPRRWYKFANN